MTSYIIDDKYIINCINCHGSITQTPQGKKLRSPLETACVDWLKWLLEYENFNTDLLTGSYIGVVFEQKRVLLPVYVLFTIHFHLTLDPNDPD